MSTYINRVKPLEEEIKSLKKVILELNDIVYASGHKLAKIEELKNQLEKVWNEKTNDDIDVYQKLKEILK